jgi:hypothetical protein
MPLLDARMARMQDVLLRTDSGLSMVFMCGLIPPPPCVGLSAVDLVIISIMMRSWGTSSTCEVPNMSHGTSTPAMLLMLTCLAAASATIRARASSSGAARGSSSTLGSGSSE